MLTSLSESTKDVIFPSVPKYEAQFKPNLSDDWSDTVQKIPGLRMWNAIFPGSVAKFQVSNIFQDVSESCCRDVGAVAMMMIFVLFPQLNQGLCRAGRPLGTIKWYGMQRSQVSSAWSHATWSSLVGIFLRVQQAGEQRPRVLTVTWSDHVRVRVWGGGSGSDGDLDLSWASLERVGVVGWGQRTTDT